MNKLFSKVAALSVGLAMAIGVGVAVSSKEAKVAKAADSNFTLSSADSVTVDGVTVSFAKGSGSSAPAWYDNGLRLYVSNTITISSESTITGVTFNWEQQGSKAFNTVTANVGNYTHPSSAGVGTWSGEANEIVFTCGTISKAQLQLNTFSVTHSSSSAKTMVIYQGDNAADGGTFLWSSSAGIYTFTAKEDSTAVTDVAWSVSDSTVATINASTGALTCVKPGEVIVFAEADGYNKASATIEISKSWLEELSLTGSMTKTSYSTAESWSPAGLTVTATYHSGWTEDASSEVTWTYNPASPAEGVTSVIATATLGEESVSSDAQSVTVTVAHAGTAEDPFTVAEALAKCAEIGAVGNKGKGPWVTKGIISRVTSTPSNPYWNATYYISDDGSQNNELQVYRGLYLDNAQFDETTALLLTAGKVVTVTGNLTGSYGSEYCQGNYLLALEEQDTGDVDVTFAPAVTSFEIGATGTFTASSETSGVVFSWSVDDSSILTVNASSGEFEAVGLGVARVTVTATVGDKEGSTYADITVNGATATSVAVANTIAASLPSSGASSTTGYYIYVGGYVKEFATTKDKDSNPTGFDIFDLNEQNSITVYTNKTNYETFINGLSLGDYVVIKANVQNYNSVYELTGPTKVSTAKSCLSFVFEFKSYTEGTEGICTEYDGKTSNKAAFEAIWSTLEASYNALSDDDKDLLVSMTGCGDTLVNAMGLYDYVTGKYELDNFVTGRTPKAFINVGYNNSTEVLSNDNTMIIVITIAAVSALAFTTLLVFKKKKQK